VIWVQAQWARSVQPAHNHTPPTRGVMVLAGGGEGPVSPLQLTHPAAAVPSLAERLGASSGCVWCVERCCDAASAFCHCCLPLFMALMRESYVMVPA